MNIIVAGGRDFEDYELLRQTLNYQLITVREPVIVCGEARGADSLGRRYAEEYGLKIKSFPADWAKYGRSAGFKRNLEMANIADALIAFWDGKSKGTKHMIDTMKALHKTVKVVKYGMEDRET